MSGKVRDGEVPALFSPGAGLSSASASETSAYGPNTRNSGPFILLLSTRVVPSSPPSSFCSHR